MVITIYNLQITKNKSIFFKFVFYLFFKTFQNLFPVNYAILTNIALKPFFWTLPSVVNFTSILCVLEVTGLDILDPLVFSKLLVGSAPQPL